MKETIKKGVILGITFFITVFTLFVVSAAIDSIWTSPDTLEASSGSVLTSSSWNKLLSNFNYLNSKAVKQDSEVITVSGSNVGIGTMSPTQTLDVIGNIKAGQYLFSTDTGNLNYVRIGNVQICWGTTESVPVNSGPWATYNYYHDYSHITFPVAFKTGTIPSVTTSCGSDICGSGANSINNTGFNAGAFTVNNNGQTFAVTWMAIGVWQ